MATAALPTYEDVSDAHERLRNVAHRTPVFTSRFFDERVGAECFFKCENFQRIGAFKFRGAYNAISRLSDDEKSRGVVAYSSGNHAQAVALASRLLGVEAVIVMPSDAPRLKRAATEGHGAEVVEYDRSETAREQLAQQIAQERGGVILPPFDHPHVIAGQGTAAKEFFEDAGPFDTLLVCVGGGGLISGCALAARTLATGCRVIGVEPEAGDDVCRSFAAGRVETVENPKTIADGARTDAPSELTLAIILKNVDEMVTVTDEALVRAMRFFGERMKMIVEPTGCLAAAALLEGVVTCRGGRVGIIVSGGNVDLSRYCELLAGEG